MIIFIDSLNNIISFYSEPNRKGDPISFSLNLDFPLRKFENKINAINELLKKDESQILRAENNTLIVCDDNYGFGTVTLPIISKRKMNDIFTTRFRTFYPNTQNYYLNFFEYSRDEKESVYFYEFYKRDAINLIVTTFKNGGVEISGVNTLSSTFANLGKENPFPVTNLVLGKYGSELFICKAGKVYSVTVFDFGYGDLLEDKKYLTSIFGNKNTRAIPFAEFIKENVLRNDDVNDFNISRTETNTVLSTNDPKELRLLQGVKLNQYIKRNNVRKLYSRILEIIEYYSIKPWYFPFKEISVIAPNFFFVTLSEVLKEDGQIQFIDLNNSLENIVREGAIPNPLFSQRFKKERRKIDWAKFFTMEIGKKKKD